MLRHLRALIALTLALGIASSGQAQNNTGRQIRVMTLYDLSQTLTPTYCALGVTKVGTALISAAASNTITSAGTPFAEVAVGDELQISSATASPTFYLVGVEAKASSASITGAYRNPSTHATSAMTFTNATFQYRTLTCGTGNENGIIPVNYGPFSIQVTTERFAAGSISWHIQCRTSTGAPWTQISPALVIPASTATYDSITAVSSYSVATASPFSECRVGLFLAADAGVQAVSVTASMRNQ